MTWDSWIHPDVVVDNIRSTTRKTLHRPTGFYPVCPSEMIIRVDGREPPTRWGWFWFGALAATATFATIAAVV